MWENKIDINKVFEFRGSTTMYFGNGAISKMEDIAMDLAKRDIDKVMIVTDKVIYDVANVAKNVEDVLRKNNIDFKMYNEILPNPNTEMVDEITKIGKESGAKALIAIGGGSHIDAAKSAAILMEDSNSSYNCQELYEYKFTPEKALPVVTINTTHGTGTEVDRFAVVTIEEKQYKPAIAYNCSYPLFSINDPNLTKTLPKWQSIYTAIDAVNHVVESSTTKCNSPYSILLGKETIRLVDKYLQRIIENPEDMEARYYVMYASSIAGVSFDNGLLHFTHALEHPLSGVNPKLTHGLGLAILLPAVIKAIYKESGEILVDIFGTVLEGLKGTEDEAEEAAKRVEKWLNKFGISEKLEDEGFTEENIDDLVELVFNTPSLGLLLSVAPVEATKDIVKQIYMDSLKPMN